MISSEPRPAGGLFPRRGTVVDLCRPYSGELGGAVQPAELRACAMRPRFSSFLPATRPGSLTAVAWTVTVGCLQARTCCGGLGCFISPIFSYSSSSVPRSPTPLRHSTAPIIWKRSMSTHWRMPLPGDAGGVVVELSARLSEHPTHVCRLLGLFAVLFRCFGSPRYCSPLRVGLFRGAGSSGYNFPSWTGGDGI